MITDGKKDTWYGFLDDDENTGTGSIVISIHNNKSNCWKHICGAQEGNAYKNCMIGSRVVRFFPVTFLINELLSSDSNSTISSPPII